MCKELFADVLAQHLGMDGTLGFEAITIAVMTDPAKALKQHDVDGQNDNIPGYDQVAVVSYVGYMASVGHYRVTFIAYTRRTCRFFMQWREEAL